MKNSVFNIFFLIVFSVYGLYLLKKYKEKIISISLFYFLGIWQLASLIYIETGTYILEQQRYSFETGATWRFFYNTWLYFIIIEIFGLRNLKKIKLKKNNSKLDMVIVLGIFCILTLMYANLFMTGIPLFSNFLNRFSFVTKSKIKIAIYISSYVSTFSFFLGIVFGKNKKIKNKALGLFIFLILYGVLVDQKFSYFFQTLPFFIWGISFNKKIELNRLIPIALLILLVILYKTSVEYKNYGKMGNSFYEKIISRVLGLQAHTYWGIDEVLIRNEENNLLSFKNELTYVMGINRDKYTTSLYKVMKEISPPTIYENYFKRNIRFSGNQLVTLIYYFNYKISFFLQLFLGIIIAQIIKKIYNYIGKGYYLEVFLYFQLYQSFLLFYSMGVVIELLTKRLLICIILIFLLKRIRIKVTRGIKNEI